MDVQQFFKKNLRYITLIILALFFIKSFQSCNRNMQVRKLEKEIVQLNDSLSTMHGTEKAFLIEQLEVAEDSIKELNYQVKLANAERDAANKRADAVQSTAERVRENTTIKIENKSETDTVSVDNN